MFKKTFWGISLGAMFGLITILTSSFALAADYNLKFQSSDPAGILILD